MSGTYYTIEVQPTIPKRLSRINELASNLLYSWSHNIRSLFFQLDPDLWRSCGHNPKLFLRRVAQNRLDEAATNRLFLEEYHRALSAYDTYRSHRGQHRSSRSEPETEEIAYFCAEFGFHESLPIYSGGLGILAGDHCKAASDLGLRFTAVGLLYRQGYFTQTIDQYGNQIVNHTRSCFEDLPISPVINTSGQELTVTVTVGSRIVLLKVWQVAVGNIHLYLLDSDLPDNTEADRSITYQLYGGDKHTRIQQEIVLGIGGVRALRALGLNPGVWHINEGHSAFQILERTREYVQSGMEFDGALELTAAGTVFTTHTPVAAGHDIFDHDLINTYLSTYIQELGISMSQFLTIGSSPLSMGGFNMTALALRGSRLHNGVSRIHGTVASTMEGYIWPQIPHQENPIGYVTNGVHVPTFLAREWADLFDVRLGSEWRDELVNDSYWQHIDSISDHSYWSLRRTLKSEMLSTVRNRITKQYNRNGETGMALERATRYLSDERCSPLVLGFARRFATYKRATLLFEDPGRLARLLADLERPVILIFAGKAHPHDLPGQQLIRTIHEFSRRPEFEGRIILLEDYDLALARKLVTGVDVWINTPEYPLEASGTSGQKAGINGVVNLSILDGWWGEGYNGTNGWGIPSCIGSPESAERNRNEARELIDTLEHRVIPLYFAHNGQGYSRGWVEISKNSMKSTLPRFNAERMVREYITRYYIPAGQHTQVLAKNNRYPAQELAAWKKSIASAWPQVQAHLASPVQTEITAGGSLSLRVAAHLDHLSVTDVSIECVLYQKDKTTGELVIRNRFPFSPETSEAAGEVHFRLDFIPPLPGLQTYRLRMYPYHPNLVHPFETGLMIWL